MTSEPFGKAFDLPSFPDPSSFRRNVVPGFIPSPTLITERVKCSDLKRGDVVLYLGMTLRHVDSVAESTVTFSPFGDPDCITSYLDAPVSMPIDRVNAITFGSLESVIPIEWIRNDSERYFGKFANQYEEYCWQTALESSESIGHCEEIGWIASRVDIKYRGTIHERLSDGSERLIEYGSDSVLAQWREEIGSPAGYIVIEDDCGRVDVEFFDSLSEIEAEWGRLSALESSLYTDDELEDSSEDSQSDSETCSRHGATDCTDPE